MAQVAEGRPAFLPQGQFAPRRVGRGFDNPTVTNAHQEILVNRTQNFVRATGSSDNNQAAVALRAMLRSSVSILTRVWCPISVSTDYCHFRQRAMNLTRVFHVKYLTCRLNQPP